MNNWIPCNEKIPERDTPILVSFRSGKIDIYFGGNPKYFSKNILAWMPLPDPYNPDLLDNSHDFSNACELCVHKNVSCTGCELAK